MRIEVKKDGMIIVPESDIDKAFIEDSMELKNNDSVVFTRINDVGLGFENKENYVLVAKKQSFKTTLKQISFGGGDKYIDKETKVKT